MQRKVIRTKTVQGISSRVYRIVEDGQTLADVEKKIGKDTLLREVFAEQELTYSELYQEYSDFIANGNSENFAWMYVLNEKFGIVIDEHIYLSHYELDMCKQQNEIIPWEYMDSKKYIGDTWWFDDEEIINDIQQLSDGTLWEAQTAL